jgi:hypothetical protein
MDFKSPSVEMHVSLRGLVTGIVRETAAAISLS